MVLLSLGTLYVRIPDQTAHIRNVGPEESCEERGACVVSALLPWTVPAKMQKCKKNTPYSYEHQRLCKILRNAWKHTQRSRGRPSSVVVRVRATNTVGSKLGLRIGLRLHAHLQTELLGPLHLLLTIIIVWKW